MVDTYYQGDFMTGKKTGADLALADHRRFLPFTDEELGKAFLDRATHTVYFEGSDEFKVITKFTALDAAIGGVKGTIADLKRRAAQGENMGDAADVEIKRFSGLIYNPPDGRARDIYYAVARTKVGPDEAEYDAIMRKRIEQIIADDHDSIYKKYRRDRTG